MYIAGDIGTMVIPVWPKDSIIL